MTPTQKRHIDVLIPYRMKAVDTLNVALRLISEWKGNERSMAISFDSKLCIEGNSNGWTNPVIECGIVHCRALLDFLGIKLDRKDSATLKQRSKKSADDVAIEDFFRSDGVPLALISVDDVASRYPGPRDEAERSLAMLILQANRGVAHLTPTDFEEPELLRLSEIGSRGIPSLLVSYLYIPLGLPAPDYKIKSRRPTDPL